MVFGWTYTLRPRQGTYLDLTSSPGMHDMRSLSSILSVFFMSPSFLRYSIPTTTTTPLCVY